MSNANDSEPESELFHLSINPAAPTTIVFIHGVLSCHLEWAHVTPFLASDYHLLVVDANGHSGSAAIQPTDISSSADRVAALIRKHAKNEKAHLVGLSMGGFIALDLARRYPDLVQSIFVTGAHPFRGLFKWMAEHPSVVWYIMGAFEALPDSLYFGLARWRGMVRHEELRKETTENRRWETVRDVYGSLLAFGWDEVSGVNVPAAVVAGGKQDDVEATRMMGPLLRGEGGSERSKAFVVRKAVHAWDLQFPELFAAGLRAWIEGGDMPGAFEELV
ncbi:Alpha/Beta hydrolase protein [Podospora didyma]|uniref:Alpha/Beta hydrolase protein n=1 Tax=Podospora didyma TaxID=330526 RepID=A0AAE0NY84_9PEZI|nr:Alpha/Beta hydrolase protein [Podospora didyma]